MRLKTIRNRIEKPPGVLYEQARWSTDGKTIQGPLRPAAARSQPVCSCCGERGPGYDPLQERRFQDVPLWARAVVLV